MWLVLPPSLRILATVVTTRLESQGFCAMQTKGVPIEEVSHVVRSHWLWRRVAYKGGVIPPLNVQVVDGVPIEGKLKTESV